MGLTQEIGSVAETAAADYLRTAGFEILQMNWRHGRYEIDIIARKGKILHIVEVKCRRFGSLTTPEEAITAAKAGALEKAASAYLEETGLEAEVQFDLAAVDYGDNQMTVRYIPNAIEPRW